MQIMSDKLEQINLSIIHQGAIIVNRAFVYQRGENVCAVQVDMKSKRVEIFSTGNDENNAPTVALEVHEDSAYLDKRFIKDPITEFVLPDFPGWTVWSISEAKHSIYMCLVKTLK
jgi:hypothetical protein